MRRPHRHHDLNQAEDVEGRIKRNPVIGTLIVAALVISSVLTIAGAVGGTWGWVQQRTEWRAREYKKLTALRADYSIEKFKEQLGSPQYVHVMTKQKLTENTFKGRDYWVSAIRNSEGTVVQYAVTACDAKFQPTFEFGKGGSSEGSVTLNVTTMPDMDHLLTLQADYVFPGNTANNYMFEVFYGANPGGYRTYAWGVNDACPQVNASHPLFVASGQPGPLVYAGPISGLNPVLQETRKQLIVNTYVETAPARRGQTPAAGEIIHGENGQIGVDRITVR